MKRPWIALSLCLACGLWSTNALAEGVIDKLLSSDSNVRLEGVAEFNKLPTEAKYKLVPDLMVALNDDSEPEKQKIASRILKVMGVSTTGEVPDARKALADQIQSTETAKVLPEPPKPVHLSQDDAFPDMRKEMDAEKQAQDDTDLTNLKSSSDMHVGSPLLAGLKDPDPLVRAHAAQHLGSLRPMPEEAIPTLITLMDDQDVEVRVSAAGALAAYGPAAQSALPTLQKRLADPDPGVRTVVADAIKQINSPQ